MGMKFGSGSRGKNGMIGCLDLIHDILRKSGKKVPDEWRGLTIENYGEWVKENPDKVNDMLIDLVKEVGREMPIAAKLGGDVLIIEQEGNLFPAIYIGNEHAVASFVKLGVSCFRIDEKQKVVSAWRIT